jgi:hypothetical protein
MCAELNAVRAVRKPGFNLPSLQGNEILMAVAALALIIIIPQIVVYFFYNAENAFIGFMLAVEQSIVRLLLLAFRSVSSSSNPYCTALRAKLSSACQTL